MTRLLTIPFIALAAPAFAHPGHLAAEGGHNHYVAVAATALAGGIVAFGVARAIVRRKRKLANG